MRIKRPIVAKKRRTPIAKPVKPHRKPFRSDFRKGAWTNRYGAVSE
jgi:hypothetical protein